MKTKKKNTIAPLLFFLLHVLAVASVIVYLKHQSTATAWLTIISVFSSIARITYILFIDQPWGYMSYNEWIAMIGDDVDDDTD